jgi:large repetitive protein
VKRLAASLVVGLAFAGAAAGAASAATAPANTAVPTVAGTAEQGQTLTASTGSWSGDAPISYTFAWQRCSGSGGSCSDISGASNQTYVVASGDVGNTLRVVVGAANSAGHSSAASSPTGTVVADNPPRATKQPDPHGTAEVGKTVTVDDGSWSGTTPLTFTYQWQHCSSSGACTNLSGATKSSYVPVTGDVGYRLRAIVTAKNSAGSASIASNVTGTVAATGTAPAATKQPDPHGTAQVGQTVTVDNGTWSGTSPITYTYQWQRCSSSGTCTNLSGATKSSYVPATGDIGYRLRATVTAKNSVGSASIASNATAPVVAAATAPANTARPSIIARSATVGSTVSGSIGTWSGTQPISYSLTWVRCDSSGNNCQSIAGASAQTYVLAAADAGSTVELVVKGSNSAGSSVAASAATPVVTNELPGAIRLESGLISIPATSISLPNRVLIAKVHFSRHPLRSRRVFTARIRITDAHGHVVRGALVHVLGIPYSWIAGAHEVTTGMNGYAVVRLRPTRHLPLEKGNALVLAVRARRPGDGTLAGTSAHRLVQLQLAPAR